MYEYLGHVLRVVDGDTLDLQLDLGLETMRQIRVRLDGLDAPEHNTAAGKEATAFVREWVAQEGPSFTVRTVKDRTEKFGRYLAEVWGKETCLNTELLAKKHAKPYAGGART